jgi:transmembrane sensor
MTQIDMDAEAARWAVLADDPQFEDWAALAAWLAADPGHAIAFDRATIAAEEAATMLRSAVPLPSAPQPTAPLPFVRPAADRRRWRRMMIPATALLAAGLALVFFIGLIARPQPGTPADQLITTRPGELRLVDLGSNGQVALNGDTQLRRDPAKPDMLTLTRGEASFHIVHNAARPFVVHARNVAVIDIGTRFDIAMTPTHLRIAVAQGMVRVRSGSSDLQLAAGQQTLVALDGDAAPPSAVEVAEIGSWRSGQLTYADSTIGQVVADVRQRAGIPLNVAPGLAARPFAGSINVRGDAEQVIRRLEATLGVRAARDRTGWVLHAADDAR